MHCILPDDQRLRRLSPDKARSINIPFEFDGNDDHDDDHDCDRDDDVQYYDNEDLDDQDYVDQDDDDHSSWGCDHHSHDDVVEEDGGATAPIRR